MKRGRPPKHGASRTPEFVVWRNMKMRCHLPSNPDFKRYGARGITVCARWRESFAAFLADIGPRPSPQHSLDRIDNGGNYEPGNCRWATRSEQARNRRDNVWLVIDGERVVASAFNQRIGVVDNMVFLNRIRRGWEPMRAATTPPDAIRSARVVAGLAARREVAA